jgi:histidine triad (HIT) family protein
MACNYCDIISGKRKTALLYQDDKLMAFMAEQPATIGHMIVLPKKHLPIFEASTDEDAEKIFKVANKASIALFEAIKCEGTNILINNGIDAGQEEPHFSINLIARREGDGLSFEWAPKQLSEEEMASVEIQLKEELSKKEPKAEPAEEKTESKEGKKEDKTDAEESSTMDKEENYLIKQLKRMP